MIQFRVAVRCYTIQGREGLMKYRSRRNYTSKFIEGLESGYGEVRLYPQCKTTSKRHCRSMKTLASQQKANEKRSQDSCCIEAIENFGSGDYFVTLTFSPDMPDEERIKKQKKVIRYLQRIYKKYDNVLKYIYNWGRGVTCEKLHSHMLLNKAVPLEKMFECEKIYKGVHIDVRRIDSFKQYDNDADNIRYIVFYLFYPHWNGLTDDDKKIIKKHYYGSHSLNKYVVSEIHDDEIDHPITESPSKLLAKIVKAKDSEKIDKIIQSVYKGYRLVGFYYNNGNSPIYTDDFGQSFCRLRLVRIGSRLDNNTIRIGRNIIDIKTGEVIK